MVNCGFVKKGEYTQNADGTFTCKINQMTDPKKSTDVIIVSSKCIGIFNVNNIISPNRPDQMIILSDDNKYIFLQINLYNNTINNNEYVEVYSLSLAFINYGVTIPNYTDLQSFIPALINFPAPTNDSTYNSLPEGSRKMHYKAYLMGLNIPNELLNINSDRKVWSSMSYLFKTVYDLNYDTDSYVGPPSYCVKIDSPTVLSNVSKYDCRSNVNASPVITKSINSTGLTNSTGGGATGGTVPIPTVSKPVESDNTVTYVVVSVVVLALLGGGAYFMMGSSAKAAVEKKKGGHFDVGE